MLNDPLADTLARIKNALAVRADQVELRSSKLIKDVLEVLVSQGYVGGFEVSGDGAAAKIVLNLKYYRGQPAIRKLVRVSKVGRRVYKKVADLSPSRDGLGIFVVSTSKGIVADSQAREQNLGGEVLIEVY